MGDVDVREELVDLFSACEGFWASNFFLRSHARNSSTKATLVLKWLKNMTDCLYLE